MNQIVFAAGVLLFPAVCTTLGAAGVFLLRRSAAPRTQRVLSGMAAGIMLAASVWSLLLPAIERTRELGVAAWVPPSAGLVLGAAGLLRLESMAGQLLQRGKSRMVLAVTLHNLPEGMVVGLAAALALSGEPDAVSGALALSLGIGLQNIPEGAAVSLPLAHSGRTRLQAFGAGAVQSRSLYFLHLSAYWSEIKLRLLFQGFWMMLQALMEAVFSYPESLYIQLWDYHYQY